MKFDLSECTFVGTALPNAFLQLDLSAHLRAAGLLVDLHGRAVEQRWSDLRRQLCPVGPSAGMQSVRQHILLPLVRDLGFDEPVRQDAIATRDGPDDGGWLATAACGTRLRSWPLAVGADFDGPMRPARAYRASPVRSAQRVLLANGESIGLLTDGLRLRVLLCDPIRQDSHVTIPLGGGAGWRGRNLAPDSYRLLHALATPRGIAALPDLLEAARLAQARVTKDLRQQARAAVQGFLQAVLDHPDNAGEAALHQHADALWQQGLIVIYRLLFIFKLESAVDPAQMFSFASTALWRTALSPNQALGRLARHCLDDGHNTGHMLEDGLRLVFRMFRDGLVCSELSLAPLGGELFADGTTPLLDRLAWGERAVALLLDRLLWTSSRDRPRERVHYGALDVEELGHVYEALLELEPGIATEPMVRLRRGTLEVVLPAAQAAGARCTKAVGTQTAWIEAIPAHSFYLRASLGRKMTGSFYTPHPFVRFLVRETLQPLVQRGSPDADPNPLAILALKVLDPATGSGHFLVEACRYLGEALYQACRLCDELAAAEPDESRAAELRARIGALPDPQGRLVAYLAAGDVSRARASAICRRFVAIHCLYGVDKNPLAVELAKLSLWLESYSEGLPLTFLDHRLIHGDALAGPWLSAMVSLPVSCRSLDPPLAQSRSARHDAARQAALREVHTLQGTIGTDAADLALKTAAKLRLDRTMQPVRNLAYAWSGAAMLATGEADDAWHDLARAVAATGTWPASLTRWQQTILDEGDRALAWELTFPDVFQAGGFDAVLGNPPWDMVQPRAAEFLAAYDLGILDARDRRAARAIERRLLSQPHVAAAFYQYQEGFTRQHRLVKRLYRHQRTDAGGAIMGGKLDVYRLFAERAFYLCHSHGSIGMVMPSAFHANEGATALRQLYLRDTAIDWYLSFENRRRLFDIHQRFRFALLVTRRPGPTTSIRCAFYLSEFGQIGESDRLMRFTRDFVDHAGGPHATLPELRGPVDLALAQCLYTVRQRWGDWLDARGITLSRELHMTDDAPRFTTHRNRALAQLILHEGKTIHQFRDRWDTAPRYLLNADRLRDKPQTIAAAQYYRAACREIARSTDERTAIATMLPPGVVCGHTISVERYPAQRPNAAALIAVAVMNSFVFDWLLRQKAAVHASLYLLAALPVPDLTIDAERALAHGSLRLCCNHAGYAALWHEQLGASHRMHWPAVACDADRWRLRANMDAIVACGYGLGLDQYRHVLASFSHRSCRAAQEWCLAAFNELTDIGLAAFCRKHDAYHRVELISRTARPLRRVAMARPGELAPN